MTLQERLWKKPWKDLKTGQKWGRIGLWFVVVLLPLAVAGSITGAYFAGHANGYDKAVNDLSGVPDSENLGDDAAQANVAPLPSQENFVVSEQNGAENFGREWAAAVNAGSATQEAFYSALANSALPEDLKQCAISAFNANLSKKETENESEGTEPDAGNEGEQNGNSGTPETVSSLENAEPSDDFITIIDGVTFNYNNGVLASVTMQDDLGREITATVQNGKVSAESVASGVSSVMNTSVSSGDTNVSKLTSSINAMLDKLGADGQAEDDKDQSGKAGARGANNNGPSL